MHKLLKKLKPSSENYPETIPSHEGGHHADSPHAASPIHESDVYRYRKHRGVNLGSWFVLEPWIAAQPFTYSAPPGQSDLDVSRGANAKSVLEEHWDGWIGDADWEWIAGRGLNAVRIPIGYYHLCGVDRGVLKGTDFEPYFDVYSGAWARIVGALRKAAGLGIGVLIDLHAAPGAQNASPHSGTSTSHPSFFTHAYNQKHTIYILKALLQALLSLRLPNILGIELLNEPEPPSDAALLRWYTDAIKALRAVDTRIPIYLGECWRTGVYADSLSTQRTTQGMAVLDHHLYRCFTAEDIHTSVESLTRAIEDPNGIYSTLASASEKMGRAGGGVIVGEWSGALNPGSLIGILDAREAQRRYVDAQLRMFKSSCAGWFFWAYKKERKGDTGWSLRDAVECGVFPAFVGTKNRSCFSGQGVSGIDGDRNQEKHALKEQALAEHTQYWSQYPASYDHSLFGTGFLLGWDDAYHFIRSTRSSSSTVNEIGFTGAWAKKRVVEQRLGVDYGGKHYWEFEHGVKQGADAALNDYISLCASD